MKPSKPCKKCGKHPRLKGMFYCAECKAEIARLTREKKRAYMKVYTAAKKAAAVAAVKEAAETVAAALTPPQPGQWTTTSITTVTTNGDNPPTVHTETKTTPASESAQATQPKTAKKRRYDGLCPRCGKTPKLPGRHYCSECLKEHERMAQRKRYRKQCEQRLSGQRTGAFAEPCARCGVGERLPGRNYCKDCYNAMRRAKYAAKKAVNPAKKAVNPAEETIQVVKLCSRCGKNPREKGQSGLCIECRREYQREWYWKHAERMREVCREKYAKRKAALEMLRSEVTAGTPLVVQQNVQNNAPTVIPEKLTIPPVPEIPKVAAAIQPDLPFDTQEKAPIVVQQNNIQNNAPMHDLETVVPKEQVLNVNVTNPIKVDVQHNTEHNPHWWVGYIVAAAFFLMWLGTMVKNWFK